MSTTLMDDGRVLVFEDDSMRVGHVALGDCPTHGEHPFYFIRQCGTKGLIKEDGTYKTFPDSVRWFACGCITITDTNKGILKKVVHSF